MEGILSKLLLRLGFVFRFLKHGSQQLRKITCNSAPPCIEDKAELELLFEEYPDEYFENNNKVRREFIVTPGAGRGDILVENLGGLDNRRPVIIEMIGARRVELRTVDAALAQGVSYSRLLDSSKEPRDKDSTKGEKVVLEDA